MNSIDLIKANLSRSAELVLAKIEDMKDHVFVFPTPNRGGHTMWVVGHMAYIEGLVIRKFMRGEPNPLADWEETFDGAEPPDDKSLYPPFDEVLAKCREMRRDTVALLESMTEDDMDRKSARLSLKGHEALFGTYRQCFQFVADHWYMHRGQLADARRAAKHRSHVVLIANSRSPRARCSCTGVSRSPTGNSGHQMTPRAQSSPRTTRTAPTIW